MQQNKNNNNYMYERNDWMGKNEVFKCMHASLTFQLADI